MRSHGGNGNGFEIADGVHQTSLSLIFGYANSWFREVTRFVAKPQRDFIERFLAHPAGERALFSIGEDRDSTSQSMPPIRLAALQECQMAP